MSEHQWHGPPPTLKTDQGYVVAFRAGAPDAPRVWIDMGGLMPAALLAHEPEPEVIYMRDLWPNR